MPEEGFKGESRCFAPFVSPHMTPTPITFPSSSPGDVFPSQGLVYLATDGFPRGATRREEDLSHGRALKE